MQQFMKNDNENKDKDEIFESFSPICLGRHLKE